MVIDMQNGFCHVDGIASEIPRAREHRKSRRAIVAPMCSDSSTMCRSGRRQDLVHAPGSLSRRSKRRINRRIPSHLERRGVKPTLCLKGTWDAELIDEIAALMRCLRR